jgi:ABC-type branched-subunit amino acid transport system permease subunit
MKPNLTIPKCSTPELTDGEFDRALAADHDAIVPSSGFADSVMAAVSHETSAPVPLAFPWVRALPGLVAAIVALGVLIAAIVVLLQSAPARHAAGLSISLQTFSAPMFRQAPDVLWLAVSLAISAASLLFCRRLISSR